jgi:hypothetical protein
VLPFHHRHQAHHHVPVRSEATGRRSLGKKVQHALARSSSRRIQSSTECDSPSHLLVGTPFSQGPRSHFFLQTPR